MPCCEKRAHLLLTRGRHGFPRGDLTRTKVVYGFKTADMVWGKVLQGKNAGLHVSPVAVRVTGSFKVGKANGINARYCKLLHRADGYGHAWRPRASSPCLKAGASTRGFR
jgi:hypothetical protein